MSTIIIKLAEAKQGMKHNVNRFVAPAGCLIKGHDWHVYARDGVYRTWWECYHCDKEATIYYDDVPKNWKRK